MFCIIIAKSTHSADFFGMRRNNDEIAESEADHDIPVAIPLVVGNVAILALKRQLDGIVGVVDAEQVQNLSAHDQAHGALAQLAAHVLLPLREADQGGRLPQARLANRVARVAADRERLVVAGERQQAVPAPAARVDAARVLAQDGHLLRRLVVVDEQVAPCGADREQRRGFRPRQKCQVVPFWLSSFGSEKAVFSARGDLVLRNICE